MNKSSLVSIILPTYNGSRYLCESIDSCLGQTYKNIELIIVDDGSTDNTWQIIREYAGSDKRIRPIRHETNRNLPNALNTGSAAATGELFTWTSDDNVYLPNAIEQMAEFLSVNKNTDIVYANFNYMDENGVEWGTFRTGPWYELPISDTLGACFMYYRKVHESVGGYDAERFCVEDYAFFLKAYNAGFKFAKLDELLYVYRSHENSITGQRQERVQRESLRLILENNECNADKMSDNIRMRSYLKCIRHAKNIGDRQTAMECMKKAVAINPNAPRWTSQELVEYALNTGET